MIWEWKKDDLKDEDLIVETLRDKLNKPTIAEYLPDINTVGCVGGNFVQGGYGFSRGFKSWHETSFGFMDGCYDDVKDSLVVYHQYYIHDYFEDAGWDMNNFKLNNFKNITQNDIEKGIKAYKQRILKYKERLIQFINSHPKDIIILTGDHGEAFNEHPGNFHHGQYAMMYKEIYNTPLLIKFPKGKKQKIKQLTRSIDILPTILKLYKKDISMLPGINLLKLTKEKIDLDYSTIFFYNDEKYSFYISNKKEKITKL